MVYGAILPLRSANINVQHNKSPRIRILNFFPLHKKIKEQKMTPNPCCCKALKHGESYCPVCGQRVIPFEPQRQLAIQFKEKQK